MPLTEELVVWDSGVKRSGYLKDMRIGFGKMQQINSRMWMGKMRTKYRPTVRSFSPVMEWKESWLLWLVENRAFLSS